MVRVPVSVPVGNANAVQLLRAVPPSTAPPVTLDEAPLMVVPLRTNPLATSRLLPASALEMIPAVLVPSVIFTLPAVAGVLTVLTGIGNCAPVLPVVGSTPPSTAT